VGYDLYRRDNLRDPSFDDEKYFRSTMRAFPYLHAAMDLVGVLDYHVGRPGSAGKLSESDLASRSPDPHSVPAFKFSSNESWIVTPDECLAIAAALERLLRDTRSRVDVSPDEAPVLDFIESFARFNRVCAEHGGYEVR
jgi:hypothetical protein